MENNGQGPIYYGNYWGRVLPYSKIKFIPYKWEDMGGGPIYYGNILSRLDHLFFLLFSSLLDFRSGRCGQPLDPSLRWGYSHSIGIHVFLIQVNKIKGL
jgi:hypothetical protein